MLKRRYAGLLAAGLCGVLGCADGSGQEQVVKDETNDWFPHISPDGKLMVFLSYGLAVNGHPPNQVWNCG